MQRKTFSSIKTIISLLILVLVFCISLFAGTQKLSVAQILEAFQDSSSFPHTLIFSIRLPRAILALMSGALLAASGAAFQMYFRNSLAEPGIFGISSGATLGAVSAQLLGISPLFFGAISPVNISAFLGALLAGTIIVLASQKNSSGSSIALLLCGSALGTFYAAISSVIMMTKNRQLNGIFSWLLGSFSGRGWTEIRFLLLPSLLSIFILLFCSGILDLMAGGESTARSLGVETKKLQTFVLIAASLAVSASVCAGGTINFVGLMAPHIVRKLFGTSGKKLISLSMIFGALLVLLSDLVARIVISPAELPAGIITSLLGAPFFISLIFNRNNRGEIS